MLKNKLILAALVAVCALGVTLLAVPAAGLVGYWPADGNADDQSGNNNHGILVGDTTYVPGKTGQAFSLDDRGPFAGLCVAAICLVGLLSAACGDGGVTRAAAVADELVVRRDAFQQRWLLTGELQAVLADKIGVPRTPSWQMPIRWLADGGIAVNAGDKVLELDNSQFSGELEQKRLAADSSFNELMRKQADVAVQIADSRFQVEQRRIQLEKARLEADVPEQLRSRREHQEKQLAQAQAEVMGLIPATPD